MSGIKTSTVEIRKARAERLRVQREIVRSRSEIAAIHAMLRGQVDGTPAGLRAAFPAEFAEAAAWLNANPARSDPADETSSIEVLKLQASTASLASTAGRQVSERLLDAVTRQADQMGSDLGTRLAAFCTRLAIAEPLVRTWSGEDTCRSFRASADSAQQLWTDRDFRGLSALLDRLERDVSDHQARAEKLDALHEDRLYVLKALRQACRDLRFIEVDSPRYERDGYRESAIIVAVDTRDHGRVTFRLALDGISADSGLAEHHCFGEFRQLSAFLDEHFGVSTEFTLADGSSLPNLLRKGARDVPDDSARRAEK
jgi:hypothetical protein